MIRKDGLNSEITIIILLRRMKMNNNILKGLGVSTGFAEGVVVWYETLNILKQNFNDKTQNVAEELKKMEKYIEECAKQLNGIREKVRDAVGEKEAAIFEVQALFLEDPMIVDEIKALIENDKYDFKSALLIVIKKLAEEFNKIEDEYLRGRVSDLIDVGNRLLVITGVGENILDAKGKSEYILAAEELLPSQTAVLDKKKIKGIITKSGGVNSHAAILARDLGIPAVMGVEMLDKNIDGKKVILDGDEGKILLTFTKETLSLYKQKMKDTEKIKESQKKFINKHAETSDGVKINIHANINDINDIDKAAQFNADGVGLFRTEFVYFGKADNLPSLQDQVELYKKAIEKLQPKIITFRTLDIGADKPLKNYEFKEENPALGLRGIRWSLGFKDVLATQLKAILIAAYEKDVKIMFPMVCFKEEVKIVKKIMAQIYEELKKENILFNDNPKIGIMIETPAAALAVDLFANGLDFFSIGSNDLTQYTLAVDRTNDKVQHLYDTLHPSVLRLIDITVKNSVKYNKELGICGEAAADFKIIPVLIGLGMKNLSVNVNKILAVREFIAGLNYDECVKLAKGALQY